jgi:hypothetical protein
MRLNICSFLGVSEMKKLIKFLEKWGIEIALGIQLFIFLILCLYGGGLIK